MTRRFQFKSRPLHIIELICGKHPKLQPIDAFTTIGSWMKNLKGCDLLVDWNGLIPVISNTKREEEFEVILQLQQSKPITLGAYRVWQHQHWFTSRFTAVCKLCSASDVTATMLQIWNKLTSSAKAKAPSHSTTVSSWFAQHKWTELLDLWPFFFPPHALNLLLRYGSKGQKFRRSTSQNLMIRFLQ